MRDSPNNKSKILLSDCQNILETLAPESFQAIIADPPYFQVLLEEEWAIN
jgi:DNA modification methylase